MPVHPLTKRVWYSDPLAAGDRPVLGIAAGGRASLLIDGGNSPAHVWELLSAAKALPIPPLSSIALTHWHWDHCFGAVSAALPVLACQATERKLRWMRSLAWTDAAMEARVAEGTEMEFCRANIAIEWPGDDRKIEVPTAGRVYADSLTLDLGGLTARLLPVACDHAPDCHVVQLVEDRVVFLGDCLYLNMDRQPWYRTTISTRRLLEGLLALDADWYIPAHHGLYDREAFRRYAEGMIRLSYAAEGAEDLPGAERLYAAMTGREASDDDREVLGEYLAARQYGKR